MHILTQLTLLVFSLQMVAASGLPNETLTPDLETPRMEIGRPVPGKRVRMVAPGYKGTDVHHCLYLPTDWEEGKTFPVIVEYAGNKYKTSLGTVEGSSLGYGISGGKGFIWVCMPYVSKDHQRNQVTWWGDLDATVEYCKTVVADICRDYGGDPEALFIAGFSRGAIACNHIGLHDDEIAGLWRGFICHSHYDGVRDWSRSYAGSDHASAAIRLKRLKRRPQFISHEGYVSETQAYLAEAYPHGDFTFQPLAGWKHTDTWVLYDIPQRKAIREWVNNVLAFEPPKRNVVVLCVDDLRPELACFGVSYIQSPNIDRLASAGRVFRNHYVQAPTCGASRFTLLTGLYGGASNSALFQRAAKMKADPKSVPPSMPAWFRQNGYTTVSVGKVSHHPGGRGGKDWDDETQPEMPDSWDRHLLPAGDWQRPRGWMHGLANGDIRVRAGEMDVLQAVEGSDSIYPDGISVDEALRQLGQLASDSPKPFFLAVGILRPHLPFGCPAKYLEPYRDAQLPPTPHPAKPVGRTTWHASGEFMKYNRWGRNPNEDAEFALEVRRHYAACVSYADAQVGRIMAKLEETGAAHNTIVILWGDHGWHLGEHAIWGKHALFEESLRSPLIVSYPGIKKPGESTNSMVETLDVFPTLCDLAGLPLPDFVDGVSLRPLLDDPASPGHTAISYGGKSKTIRSNTHRLIVHNDGFVELYDHTSPEKETKNIAEAHPALVKELLAHLEDRLNRQ